MPIVARVLVALDEDRVVAGDEEPGGRVPREVLIQAETLAPVVIANFGLGRRPDQSRRHTGPMNQPALEDLVEMTEGADEEANL